jgi:hypothetical protein
MAIKHAFTSGKSDGGDTTLVQPSNWNANHTIDAATITYAQIQNVSATDKLLGRSTAGAGSIEEIALTAAGRALIDDADAAAQRTTLGLGTMATAASADYLLLAGGAITGATSVSVNSASNALRITQLGAGNALVVEDETNPDATPWLVDGAGIVVAGHTVSLSAASAQTGTQLTNGAKLQTHSTTTQLSTQLQAAWNSAAAVAPALVLAKSDGTTIGAFTTTTSGDTLGYLTWEGADGTQFTRSADIRALVNGTVSTGVVPGSLSFRVANSSGTLTERLLIAADGTGTFTGTLNATTLQQGGTALNTLYATAGHTHPITVLTGNNWKVYYTNGSGAVTELALGASGTVLQSNGTAAAPSFVTPSGGSASFVSMAKWGTD